MTRFRQFKGLWRYFDEKLFVLAPIPGNINKRRFYRCIGFGIWTRDPRVKALEDASCKALVDTNYDPHFSGVRDRAYHESVLFIARFDALMAYYEGRGELPYSMTMVAASDFSRTTIFDPRFPPSFQSRFKPDEKDREPEAERRIPIMADPIPMILFCPHCASRDANCNHVCGTQPHRYAEYRPDGEISGSCRTCGAWQNPVHRSHKCAGCGWVWRPADVPTTGVADILTRGQHDSLLIRGVINKTAEFRPQWRHKARGTVYEEIGRGELQTRHAGRDDTWREGSRLVAYRGEDNKIRFREEAEFDDGRFERIA